MVSSSRCSDMLLVLAGRFSDNFYEFWVSQKELDLVTAFLSIGSHYGPCTAVVSEQRRHHPGRLFPLQRHRDDRPLTGARKR